MALVGEQRRPKRTKSRSGCGVTARGYKGRPPPTGQGKAKKQTAPASAGGLLPKRMLRALRQGSSPGWAETAFADSVELKLATRVERNRARRPNEVRAGARPKHRNPEKGSLCYRFDCLINSQGSTPRAFANWPRTVTLAETRARSIDPR